MTEIWILTFGKFQPLHCTASAATLKIVWNIECHLWRGLSARYIYAQPQQGLTHCIAQCTLHWFHVLVFFLNGEIAKLFKKVHQISVLNKIFFCLQSLDKKSDYDFIIGPWKCLNWDGFQTFQLEVWLLLWSVRVSLSGYVSQLETYFYHFTSQ